MVSGSGGSGLAWEHGWRASAEAGEAVAPTSEGEGGEESSPPDYIGAFGKDENWLEEWTLFGAETDYDPQEADGQPWPGRPAVCGRRPARSRPALA